MQFNYNMIESFYKEIKFHLTFASVIKNSIYTLN
jgi:hypothetical protein